ncbi:MAG: glycosyltransferase family 4 protein [Anaerolineales bacterium]|nr:MAG: glycosyltransferase family 4 protein [Anaerolineales bacterium]
MRVLILSHMYPYALEPTFGLFVHDQVKELTKRCDVVTVSPTPLSPRVVRRLKPRWARYASKPRQTKLEGIQVHYPRYLNIPGQRGFPLSAFFYTWAIRGLLLKLRDTFDFDLVHAHAICPDGFAAAQIGRRLGTPVVCTIHGADINVYPHRTRLTRLVTRKALSSVGTVITVSAELKERTLALEAPRREIRVIPNGVDLRKFAPMDQGQARAELGLSDDKAIFVYASRLDEAKGLSYLLAALKRVLNHNTDCLLALVGDGPYRLQLERQVAQLDLHNHVVFAGFRPHAEIAKWMSACDLVVHPSLTEGSPLPIYEALACGRPTIASPVGGIPDLITCDDYGLLVPPADAEALGEALLSGIHRQWDHDRIRSHGEEYTWGHVADQLISLYEEVLASHCESSATHAAV